MDEICAKLDTVLTEYLGLISTFQEEWKKIGKELEGGFLQMAHAKYTMGPGRISQDQYDGRMQAFTRVLISQEEGGSVNNTSGATNFQYTLTSGQLEISKGISNDSNNSSSPLRRRAIESGEIVTDKPTKKRVLRDPLNWFGVLVPSSLRESQRHFKQGFSGMINIINLRGEIIKKEVEYQTLKREKERMMAETQTNLDGTKDE
ncbi:1201_t:CDS:2 [Acaulospora morrowiae]|uniref:Vacuolar ATPase assembly protein VMA22 n=1 Tax=Acaulospora morrowiae TaxID=94023 RepID=A0A9N9C342_9GLOM|nr:1201_t:CDS:2 [Acaulospora morrowiae]